jgi:hypothetical protein
VHKTLASHIALVALMLGGAACAAMPGDGAGLRWVAGTYANKPSVSASSGTARMELTCYGASEVMFAGGTLPRRGVVPGMQPATLLVGDDVFEGRTETVDTPGYTVQMTLPLSEILLNRLASGEAVTIRQDRHSTTAPADPTGTLRQFAENCRRTQS